MSPFADHLFRNRLFCQDENQAYTAHEISHKKRLERKYIARFIFPKNSREKVRLSRVTRAVSEHFSKKRDLSLQNFLTRTH